jgi:hypothetical protein
MRQNFVSSFVLLSTVAFVVAGGCGGDDETASPGGSGSGGKGGASSGGTSSGGTSSGATSAGGEPAGGTPGSPEPTGSTCQEANDCYAGLDTSDLSGDVACIDKVEDGYCTHECETDDDCCAVEGECRTGFKQVCASFENTDVKYCFLSCEDADLVPAQGGAGGMSGVAGAGAVDANEYCEREANPRFTCRSTGGGNENRLVCLPDAGLGGAGGGNGGPGGAGGAGGTDAGAGGMGGAAAGAGGATAGAGGA